MDVFLPREYATACAVHRRIDLRAEVDFRIAAEEPFVEDGVSVALLNHCEHLAVDDPVDELTLRKGQCFFSSLLRFLEQDRGYRGDFCGHLALHGLQLLIVSTQQSFEICICLTNIQLELLIPTR